MNTSWSKTTKYLVGVGLVLFGLFILYLSRPVIPVLIVAALIAVIARPLITWLHVRGRMPRGVAVAVVYMLIIVIVPVLLLLAVPAILDAIQYVVNLDYRRIVLSITEWLRSSLTSIRAFQMPVPSLDTYVDQMVDAFLMELQEAAPISVAPSTPQFTSIIQSLGNALSVTFGAAAGLVGAVFSTLTLLIFTFLASIYMSLRAHTYRESFLRTIPDAYQTEISMLMTRIGRMWNAFFRGEITLMLVIGAVSWLGLTILGVPGAVYLGIIAGLLEIIPNLGPVIAAIPAIIVALLQGSTYLPVSNLIFAGLVLLLCILIQQLENNFVVPRVLGDAVELPPLVVLTGVLVGASVGGILGALLATPIIGTAREIVVYVYRKLLGVDPYPPEDKVQEPVKPASTWLVENLRNWFRRLARTLFPAIDQRKTNKDSMPESDPEAEAIRHQKKTG